MKIIIHWHVARQIQNLSLIPLKIHLYTKTEENPPKKQNTDSLENCCQGQPVFQSGKANESTEAMLLNIIVLN